MVSPESRNQNMSDLLSSIYDDKLTLSETLEQLEIMIKKKDLKAKYKDSIEQRKDGRQFYIYISRKQYTATTFDGLIDILYKLEYGRINFSLADLLPEYMLWRRDYTPASDKTLKEDMTNWRRFLQNEPLAQKPLKDILPKEFIQLFRKWTKDRQVTRKQFNNVKSLLNGIYYYAIENEIVEHNPIKDINIKQFPFKPVNNDDDVFTVEERKKLLAYLADKNDIYSLAIMLDFQLVTRIGELLSLRWRDIEGTNIHIQSQLLPERKMNDDLTFSKREYVNVSHIKRNTDKGFRYQPLTSEALRILDKIRELNPDGEFILMRDGKQLNTYTFNRWLKKYCEACNIPVRSSHKIRFCVASILYDSGVPLTVLQQLLGHTTTAMTLHYLRRVTPTEDTANLMNSALS